VQLAQLREALTKTLAGTSFVALDKVDRFTQPKDARPRFSHPCKRNSRPNLFERLFSSKIPVTSDRCTERLPHNLIGHSSRVELSLMLAATLRRDD
jgi:hypothetical protein